MTIASSECIEFNGGRTSGGYGRHNTGSGHRLAHRRIWEDTNGTIPDGLFVLHTCDNPPCINIDHLFLGTSLDNVEDMIAKHRNTYIGRRGQEHHGAKLNESDVRKIRMLAASGMRQSDIASRFGIVFQTVSDIKRGKRWGWLV